MIMVFDCSAFFGSPPAFIIKVKPPKIKRAKRRIPAMVKEFLRKREIREAREGKV